MSEPGDEPMKMDIDLGAGLSNEQYIAWNVDGCVRVLRDAPHEYSITLMVYEIHKNVLRKRGVSEDDLKVGDRYVEEAKTKYLHNTD